MSLISLIYFQPAPCLRVARTRSQCRVQFSDFKKEKRDPKAALAILADIFDHRSLRCAVSLRRHGAD